MLLVNGQGSKLRAKELWFVVRSWLREECLSLTLAVVVG